MNYNRIKTIGLVGALGAEICGVDLSAPVEPALVEEIQQALLEFQVLCFRNQKLSPDRLLTFAKHLGEIAAYPFAKPLQGHPGITPVIKEPEALINFGGNWHTDTPYLDEPPKATLLYSVEIPPKGGDTMFADMYAAYESLSIGMKTLIDGLKGIYTAAQVPYQDLMNNLTYSPNPKVSQARNLHPLVRTHPETARKALYVSRCHIERIENMSEAESKPILDFLAEHAVHPQFTMRFQWTVGTLLIWDNRCVQHFALNDYPKHRREMHRITLKGDKPY